MAEGRIGQRVGGEVRHLAAQGLRRFHEGRFRSSLVEIAMGRVDRQKMEALSREIADLLSPADQMNPSV